MNCNNLSQFPVFFSCPCPLVGHVCHGFHGLERLILHGSHHRACLFLRASTVPDRERERERERERGREREGQLLLL
ncbi:hypothetical protein OIU79_010831 [Salix purpurea]|uniref:Uncharacterized protein n=1 Tax=Salix purpurea TaxID=77065 RepID=A0A9Q0QGL2_SALPP|nr:hypothetical protein OIU79_010831 [Salix purpurea]